MRVAGVRASAGTCQAAASRRRGLVSGWTGWRAMLRGPGGA